METEKRNFQRFLVSLKLEATKKDKKGRAGLVKDFSRKGMRAVFDNFEFRKNSFLDIKIQKPAKNTLVAARCQVVWKRPIKGKWEVGFRLKEFPSDLKADIIEEGYRTWVKENTQ